ncbi:hypothetical protein ACFVG1_11960 [Streptomyces bacillaris]|uniref:hypothetical protein n=1 Tax=Streptomyces bacillaris TaxID=68179 RepID=UPI0035DA82AF
MRTVSVRQIRGADLRDAAAAGELVGIQNNRALIGVMIPMSAAWTRHVIESNLSRLRQTLAASEAALKDEKVRTPPMREERQISQRPGSVATEIHQRSPMEIVSTVAEKAMAALNETLPAVEAAAGRALHLHKTAVGTMASAMPVRIGDISGKLIEEAGEAQRPLVITHERELVGILVPVTARLVQSLIEKNLSRVLHNIDLAEKVLEGPDRESLTTSRQLREEKPYLGD